MANFNLTDSSALFKTKFGKLSENAYNSANVMLGSIKKEYNFTGDEMKVAVPTFFSGGVGSGSLPAASVASAVKATISSKKVYAVTEYDREAVKAASSNEGAFVDGLKWNVQKTVEAFNRNASRILFADGTGALGTTTAADFVDVTGTTFGVGDTASAVITAASWVDYAPLVFSTSEKRTVEYFFPDDTIGIDIGGTLEALTDTPFEFYGAIKPQEIEVLPPRLEYFRIPENNYGIPAKKRIRTMPMEINTNGNDVTFTPIVDGVAGTPATFNTPHRQTVLYYFTTDSFGIDYSGELEGDEAFEFYGLAQPVDVEILPVGKKFDQVGPMELDRLGKLMGFRIRLLHTSTSLPFKIYMNDVEMWAGTIPTTPNVLKNYEVMRVPKTIMGTSLRIEFGPSEVFHRYWVVARINLSGRNTDNQEIPFK